MSGTSGTDGISGTSGIGAVRRHVPLLWRLLPVLLCLALGALFLVQSRGLRGIEARYAVVLAAVLAALAGYNLVRELRTPSAAGAAARAEPAAEAVGAAGPQAVATAKATARATPPAPPPATATATTAPEPEPAPTPAPGREPAAPAAAERLTAGRPLAVILLLIAVVALVETVGFFAAVPLLAFGALLITGVRRPLPLLLAGAGIWASAYLVFGVLLGIPLPTGAWG